MAYEGKRIEKGTLSLKKLSKLFYRSVLASLGIGLLVGASIVGAIMYRMSLSYQAQIDELNAVIQEKEEGLDQEIQTAVDVVTTEMRLKYDTLETEYNQTTMMVASLQEDLNAANSALIEKYSADEDDFQLLKRYSYVFDLASEDSGITVDLIKYVDEQSQRFDVNPHLMWGIYDIESSFNVNAANASSSARGLGQTLASSAKSIYENVLEHGSGSYDHVMAYDPFVNVEITTCMIARNLNQGVRATLNLYGDKTPTYPDRVLAAAAKHGYTISDSNATYPY